MQGMLHLSLKLLAYASLRILFYLLAKRWNLWNQKPFLLLFRVVLHFVEEEKGLWKQCIKLAEGMNNTLNQRAASITFAVLINAPDVGHQSRANQAQNSRCPWTQGCMTGTAWKCPDYISQTSKSETCPRRKTGPEGRKMQWDTLFCVTPMGVSGKPVFMWHTLFWNLQKRW